MEKIVINQEHKYQRRREFREYARTNNNRLSTIDVFEDKKEHALAYLADEARRKYSVVTEGPPVYLWPAVDSQQWDSMAFLSGWNFVNTLQERLPENKSSQYVLIDDLNFRPRSGWMVSEEDQKMQLQQSSVTVGDSAIFSESDQKVKKFSEVELAREMNTTTCSVIDAAFNRQKITDQLAGFGGPSWIIPQNLDTIMLIVVNPETPEIRSEQLNMFGSLYNQLRAHPAFEKVSKEMTRRAITQTFRHVWINSAGGVTSITKPEFLNNRFEFHEKEF